MSTDDYEVDGWFEEDGTFEGTMEIKRDGQSPQPLSIRVPFLPGEESCGRVQVQPSIFEREADVIRSSMRLAGMEIGRAHVCTPATKALPVCRLLRANNTLSSLHQLCCTSSQASYLSRPPSTCGHPSS